MAEVQRIGIVGDGQLGRMIAEAAIPLGYEVTVLGMAGPDSPAAQVGARQIEGGLKDPAAIRSLVEQSDVTTWEIEHIDARTLIGLEREGHAIHPSPRSLLTIQDKLQQKTHFTAGGFPVAPFMALESGGDLGAVRDQLGDGPLIAKTRTGGYDGRGNLVLRGTEEWEDIAAAFTDKEGNLPELYVERIIPFKRELAVIGVRNMAGHVALYPVVETVHKNNICHTVIAPAEATDRRVQTLAQELGRQTIQSFGDAGVFAIEMFETEEGEVLINEVAPRVHNSGHWTDLGAETSQFEQHVRAIADLPLGSTALTHPVSVMVNILGTHEGVFHDYMRTTIPLEGGHVRWYGKAPRPGVERKIGHITTVGTDSEEVLERARVLHALYTA